MATTEIVTYQDLVEHLLDVFDSLREGRPLRLARRACHQALRDLAGAHRWAYYDAVRPIRTVAAVSTGTIFYDHTGGAYERLVTLTGSTFPTDARYYRLYLDGAHYPIDTYVDSTHVLLGADDNPGADIPGGSSYIRYRNSYPLPVGFVELGELWDTDSQAPLPLITSDESHREQIYWAQTPATPWQACIRNDGEYLNSLSLVFGPPPAEALNYSFTYHRSPRQLITDKYATGTVTVTGGSTTCSITTGSFATAHVGCIIRFGTSANEPDGMFGGLTDTENPFVAQRTILAVATDGTSCTLDSSLPSVMTAVKFTVSDPVDLEHTAMLTALQRMAEATYSILTKRELKERNDRQAEAFRALLFAKERDSRTNATNVQYDSPLYDVTITDLEEENG